MVSVTYSCQAATRCHACRYVTDECVTELLRPICQVEAVRDCPAQLSLRLGPPLAPLPLQLCSLLALLLLALLLPLTSPSCPYSSRLFLPLHPRLRCIIHLLH